MLLKRLDQTCGSPPTNQEIKVDPRTLEKPTHLLAFPILRHQFANSSSHEHRCSLPAPSPVQKYTRRWMQIYRAAYKSTPMSKKPFKNVCQVISREAPNGNSTTNLRLPGIGISQFITSSAVPAFPCGKARVPPTFVHFLLRNSPIFQAF